MSTTTKQPPLPPNGTRNRYDVEARFGALWETTYSAPKNVAIAFAREYLAEAGCTSVRIVARDSKGRKVVVLP